jgi:integrase
VTKPTNSKPAIRERRDRERGNRQGSVYPDRGRWRAALPGEPDPTTGRPKIYTKSAPTKRAAEKLLEEMLRERDAGMSLETVTLTTFLTGWLERQRVLVKGSTWKSRELHVRLYLIPALGNIAVGKLTPSHVEGMMAGMVERGLSPRSARHARATLRKALAIAVRDGLAVRNAAVDVELPRMTPREAPSLTGDEVNRLLEVCAADDSAAADAVIVAAMTGMRLGEVLGIRRDEDLALDDPRPHLTVRKSLTRSHAGGWELADPKTARSRREVKLPIAAVRALRRQSVRQKEQRLAAGGGWQDSGLVFTNELGAFLHPTYVSRIFKKVLAPRAGIRPEARFHDTRHANASLALAEGVPVPVVSANLGHADASITYRIYAHAVPTQRDLVADAMDKLFGEEAQA